MAEAFQAQFEQQDDSGNYGLSAYAYSLLEMLPYHNHNFTTYRLFPDMSTVCFSTISGCKCGTQAHLITTMWKRQGL